MKTGRTVASALAASIVLAGCGGSANPATRPSPKMLVLDRVVMQLTPQLESQSGRSVDSIECPELPLPFAQGTSFHCQVAFTDGTTMALYVSQSDDRGTVAWTAAG